MLKDEPLVLEIVGTRGHIVILHIRLGLPELLGRVEYFVYFYVLPALRLAYFLVPLGKEVGVILGSLTFDDTQRLQTRRLAYLRFSLIRLRIFKRV